jgi:hypothetical protein
VARITPTLPSPIKGEGSPSASAKPSPSMGEGWEGVIVGHEYAHRAPHRGNRYQVTSATTPISIAKA